MNTSQWAEENGSNGACKVCGRKMWIEHGCAAVCSDACEAGEPECHAQTLADVGMCEADFR